MQLAQTSQYWLLRLRTSKKYLFFLLLQCILSILIIVLGVINHEHLKHPGILFLEYLLAVTILLDIVIRKKTETDFFKKKQNVFDVALYIVLIGLLISITAIGDGGVMLGLEADDIIALSMLIARQMMPQLRYMMQIIRLIFLVKKSHDSMTMQSNIKQLNLSQGRHESTENQNSERIKDHIIRNLSEKSDFVDIEMVSPDTKHQPLAQEL